MKNKDIKVIFTGGTIGSFTKGGETKTDEASSSLLLSLSGENTDRFSIARPVYILSENMLRANQIAIAKSIDGALKEDNKGIIVTHGTDTLAFGAPFYSMLFTNAKKPIVMVSSNKVLNNPLANGVANFKSACRFIEKASDAGIGGVFVSYKNPSEDFTRIHMGSRIQEPTSQSEEFYGFGNTSFATVSKDGYIKFLQSPFKSNSSYRFDLSSNKNNNGLLVRPHPNLDYSLFKSLLKKPAFVLQSTYHSGTICNAQDDLADTSTLDFGDYCAHKDIPFYLADIRKQENVYESSTDIEKHSITPLYNTLSNVAYSKLDIAYNFINNPIERKDFLSQNVAGEDLEVVLKEYDNSLDLV